MVRMEDGNSMIKDTPSRGSLFILYAGGLSLEAVPAVSREYKRHRPKHTKHCTRNLVRIYNFLFDA